MVAFRHRSSPPGPWYSLRYRPSQRIVEEMSELEAFIGNATLNLIILTLAFTLRKMFQGAALWFRNLL